MEMSRTSCRRTVRSLSTRLTQRRASLIQQYSRRSSAGRMIAGMSIIGEVLRWFAFVGSLFPCLELGWLAIGE